MCTNLLDSVSTVVVSVAADVPTLHKLVIIASSLYLLDLVLTMESLYVWLRVYLAGDGGPETVN